MAVRAEIQRDDLCLPAFDDFIAAFGFDAELDTETLVEEYSLEDGEGFECRFWLGVVEKSFSLELTKDGQSLLNIAFENLKLVTLSEEEQMIHFFFGADRFEVKLRMTVWPKVAITIQDRR